MLATETAAIASLLRDAMIARYGADEIDEHFADTSDTLCYATNENQSATQALIDSGGHVGIIVGGYNSSNTSHLVELCEEAMPTYFISDAAEMTSPGHIRHFNIHTHEIEETDDWLPDDRPLDIVLTAGASCPDAQHDEVMVTLLESFPGARSIEDVARDFALQPTKPPRGRITRTGLCEPLSAEYRDLPVWP